MPRQNPPKRERGYPHSPEILLDSESDSVSAPESDFAPKSTLKKIRRKSKATKQNEIKGTAQTAICQQKLSEVQQKERSHRDAYDPITEPNLHKLYAVCQEKIDYQQFGKNVKCCAVCGIGYPNVKFPGIVTQSIPLQDLPHIELLWDKEGIPIFNHEGRNGNMVNVCATDLEYLSQSSLWKFSLANGNHEGK